VRYSSRIKRAAICSILITALMLGQVSYGQEAEPETTQAAADQKEAAPDAPKEDLAQEEQANEEPVYEVSEKAQEAADFLMGLGLANGKEDGKFHPEQGITREEFAKLLVGVLGLENEALLSKGEQIFTDVERDRWSHAYVSMAVSMGMTRGFEDGSFRPQESVTRAQAAAMLVRCFGYNDAYVQGVWPANYISKAGELGILSGAEGEHSASLGRGDAALMVKSALHGKYLFGEDEGSMLMSKKRGIYQIRGARLLRSTSYLDTESMEFEITIDSELESGALKSGEKQIFTNPNNVYIQPGETVVIYVDKDENILYVSRAGSSGAGNPVVSAGMKAVENSYADKPYGMIRLTGDESYIEVDADSTVMLDGKSVDPGDYESVLGKDAYGSFVIKKGRLEYANLVSWDSGDFVIKSMDAQGSAVSGIDTEGGVEDRLILKSGKTVYDFYLVSESGVQRADFSSLQIGDVIRIGSENESTNSKPVYIFRNNSEGTFERVSGGSNGKSVTFRLKGTSEAYQLSDSFAYSYNGGKRVRAGSESSASIASSLNEFYNQKVKIYRDYSGDVVYVEGNFSLVIDQYGVLLDYGDAVRGEIKLLTQSGSKRVFAFEDSDEYEYLKGRVDVGSIVKYSQINTSTIKNLSDDFSENIINTDDISIISSGDDFTEDTADIGGQTYKVDSDTVFFDYSEQDPDKVKRLNWDKFKGREVVGDVEVIADTDGDYLLMMAIWSNMEGIKEDTKVGYVLDNFSLGDYRYVELQEYGSEGVKSYKLEDEYKDLMLLGRLIAYQIGSSDKINIVQADEDMEFVSGEVTSADNRYVSIEGTRYRIEDDAMGFGNGRSISPQGLDKGDIIAAYIEDGKLVAFEDLGAQPNAKIAQGVLVSVDPDSRDCFVIDVGGEEKTFACAEDVDFVFRDGYMETEDSGMDPVELFGMLAETGETVKFSYDKYTEEIYSIWIEANQN